MTKAERIAEKEARKAEKAAEREARKAEKAAERDAKQAEKAKEAAEAEQREDQDQQLEDMIEDVVEIAEDVINGFLAYFGIDAEVEFDFGENSEEEEAITPTANLGAGGMTELVETGEAVVVDFFANEDPAEQPEPSTVATVEETDPPIFDEQGNIDPYAYALM